MKEKKNEKNNMKTNGSATASDLRHRAEKIFRGKGALSPEIIAAQSPAEIWRLLHELHVHQIELEMQNEELRQAQTELDAERARYFDLYNLAPVGYCTLSAPGLIMEANLTAATLLGVDRKILVKQPLSRFILKEDQDIYYLHHKKLFATAEVQACELRLLKKDGKVFYGRLVATLYQEAGAEPICRIVISDISMLKLAERELRTLSLRNQVILEAIPDIIMEVDANKIYTWVNRAGLEFFGADALGKEAAFFFEGEQDVYEKVQLLFAGSENTFYVESWQRRRDGEKRLLAWWCRVLKDPSGNVIGALSSARDITEQKQAKKKIVESEARFRGTFDQSPVGTVIVGLDKHFIKCNKAFCNFLGYQEQELIGKTIAEITYPEDVALGMEELKQLFEGKIESVTLQKRYLRKDGNIVWGEISISLVRDADNQPLYFLPIIQDITLRKNAEENLLKSRVILAETEKTGKIGGWEFDAETLTQNWTDEIFRILEIDLNKGEPRVPDGIGFIAPEFQPMARQAIQRAIEHGEPYEQEWEVITAKGKRKWVHVVARVFREHGKTKCIRGSFQDISERKQAELDKETAIEALRSKNKELERFTYAVSHDLKSPLVTIRTFLEHLGQDITAMDIEKIKEDIGYIGSGAAKMSRLLDELLDLSRVGRKSNPPEDFSLQSVVKEALDLVAGRLTEHKVEVNIAKGEIMLCGDRTRLVEVFQNLLDNACKFMGEQKSPLIKIGVETKAGETVFFVCDNGMGIKQQFLPKLFIMFEKCDRSSEGDGIGLALVKRIIEVHGGRIWAESEGPGKGATFYFTLAKTT